MYDENLKPEYGILISLNTQSKLYLVERTHKENLKTHTYSMEDVKEYVTRKLYNKIELKPYI